MQAYKEADRSCVSTYESVWCQLVNLRDAYVLRGIPEQFHQELQQFMTEHSRRKILLTRLTTKEQPLYDELRFDRLGSKLRLEQKQIGFSWVAKRISETQG